MLFFLESKTTYIVFKGYRLNVIQLANKNSSYRLSSYSKWHGVDMNSNISTS